MLKSLTLRCLKSLGILAAAFIICFVLFVNAVKWVIPVLSHHNHYVERWMHQLFNQTVHMDSVEGGWYRFQPAFTFKKISISDDENFVTHVDKLMVTVDWINSLLHGQLLPGRVLAIGLRLDSKKSIGFLDLKEKVNVKLQFKNSFKQHRIIGMLQTRKMTFTQLQFMLDSKNFDITSLLKDANLYILANNVEIPEWFHIPNLTVKGNVDGHLWVKWHDCQIQSLQALMKSDHIEVKRYHDNPLFVDKLNLSLMLSQEDHVWTLNMEAQHPDIYFPADFQYRIALDKILLQLTGFKNPFISGWQLQVPAFEVENEDFNYKGWGILTFPEAAKIPVVNAVGYFSFKKLDRLKFYLPSLISSDLKNWIQRAFSTGEIKKGFVSIESPEEWEVSAEMKHVNINYHPDWPKVQDVWGAFYLNRYRLEMIADKATLLSTPIDHLKAIIPDIRQPQLSVNAYLKTDLSSALTTLQHCPLEFFRDQRDTQLQGPMDLSVNLDIPLNDPQKEIDAKGVVTLHKADLWLPDPNVRLQNISGEFHFSNAQIEAHDIHAEWFKMPLEFDLTTMTIDQGPTWVFEIGGQFDMASLHQKNSSPILDYFEGKTPYKGLLKFHGLGSIADYHGVFASDLRGLNISLPKPFKKGKDQPRRLHLEFSVRPQKPPEAHIKYGHLNSHITFMEDEGWAISLKDSEINGQLWISKSLPQVYRANFSKFHVSDVSFQTKDFDVRNFPPLIFNAHDFRYGDKKLGQVKIKTTPVEAGVKIQQLEVTAPNYHIQAEGLFENFSNNPQTHFTGRFDASDLGTVMREWNATQVMSGGKGKADFELHWAGSPMDIKSSHLNGTIKFQFTNGRIIQLSEDVESELGLGRLLNLFSLQSIPTLPLNLVNLVQKGFFFENFYGDFTLANGVATTANSAMVSPVAWVQINGNVGFKEKNYDMNLQIIPNITSSLPLIAGIVVSPLVGAISWVANKILAPHVGKAAEINYHITGSWDEPTFDQLPEPVQTHKNDEEPR